MTPHIHVLRDRAGIPRPDRDFRQVPAHTMAEYLSCSTKTMYRRALKKTLPAASYLKRDGRFFFIPARVVGAA